ncbi:unnamed protein product [Linum trigynum]|uniref:Uncharacterized protein n=1 Tax=Linum trigynum TaxID=586398 RepID=A0AAV2DM41_9ROSI
MTSIDSLAAGMVAGAIEQWESGSGGGGRTRWRRRWAARKAGGFCVVGWWIRRQSGDRLISDSRLTAVNHRRLVG